MQVQKLIFAKYPTPNSTDLKYVYLAQLDNCRSSYLVNMRKTLSMEFIVIGGNPESINLLEKVMEQSESENATIYEKRIKMAENTILLYYKDTIGRRIEDIRMMMKSFNDIAVFVTKSTSASLIFDDHIEEYRSNGS